MERQVVSAVTVIVRPSKVKEFKRHIRALTESARREKRNILYQWTQLRANEFTLFQQYKNLKGFRAHLDTKIIKAWEARDKWKYLAAKERYWVSPVRKDNAVSTTIDLIE